MYFIIPLPGEMTTPRLPVLAYIHSSFTLHVGWKIELQPSLLLRYGVKAFVEWNLTRPKAQQPNSATIKAAVADKLTVTQLNFFLAIAKVIEPFLKFFQSDKLLMPLVPAHSERILRNLYFVGYVCQTRSSRFEDTSQFDAIRI